MILMMINNDYLICLDSFYSICINFFSDIELPNEQGRMDILKIHALNITKHGEIGRFQITIVTLNNYHLKILEQNYSKIK